MQAIHFMGGRVFVFEKCCSGLRRVGLRGRCGLGLGFWGLATLGSMGFIGDSVLRSPGRLPRLYGTVR